MSFSEAAPWLPPRTKRSGGGRVEKGGFFFELGGCNLYIWGRVYTMHDLCTTAPLCSSRLACIPQQKGVACRRVDHKCSNDFSYIQGSLNTGDCYLKVVAEFVSR